MSKRGLGRGLDALIAAGSVDENENITEIEIAYIAPNKYQPRRHFDEEALAELAESIRQYGVIQPVVVRKTMSGYELAAGERRWRAARMAGLKVIPAVVRDYSDSEMTEIALVENIQRRDLNPMEEANAYKQLMEQFGLTQEEVAKKIGRSRSLIANTIRLLQLHPLIQEHVSRGTLSMGQAKPLLAIEDAEAQLEAANTIIDQGLTARDAEELTHKILQRKTGRNRKNPARGNKESQEFFLAETEDRLKMLFGTPVKIKQGKMKGRIEIEFCSGEDLERILDVMMPATPAYNETLRKPLVV